jgi:hypothetical protein
MRSGNVKLAVQVSKTFRVRGLRRQRRVCSKAHTSYSTNRCALARGSI